MSQEIPAEEIQKHYAAQLEVNIALMKAQQEIAAVAMPAKAAFAALCDQYGVKPEEYDFDLKAGTMTKREVK